MNQLLLASRESKKANRGHALLLAPTFEITMIDDDVALEIILTFSLKLPFDCTPQPRAVVSRRVQRPVMAQAAAVVVSVI